MLPFARQIPSRLGELVVKRKPSKKLFVSLLAFTCLFVFAAENRAATPSFRNEVMGVLSKAGCNLGTCHGNQNGKNGFKLSLRGQDPTFDLESLTRDMLGRRTNSLQPDDSLILLKAIAAVPHEGGKRFGTDSIEYRTLRQWVADGMPADAATTPQLQRIEVNPTEQVLIEPADRVNIRVRAKFSDGSERDVSRLSVFEPSNTAVEISSDGEVRRQQSGETTILVRYLNQRATVRLAFVPERPSYRWPAIAETNFIDRHIFAKLRTLRIQPSEISSESVFLRRAYLDAIGQLPNVGETRAFLADTRADKRARLVDELLQRPEFADFWALKWADVLHNEEKALDAKGVQVFHRWIRQCIADGKPMNEFARDVLTGQGNTYDQPAANFYRSLREVQTRVEAAGQVFLGIRLQCARCHNHPFDSWTQNDYYQFSAFFARVQYRIVENRRLDRLDKHEFVGEQIVYQDRDGEVNHPKTGAVMRPRVLGDSTREIPDNADRLQALGDWVARPDNPFFARTQVNRIWFHLFGKGIVEPNDDFRASNPPINPPLMDALIQDFIAHQFDLRHLVRTIMNSTTYQLSAIPNNTNGSDDINFSHAAIRTLQAEQLLDALARVTDVPVKFNSYPLGIRAGQLPGVKPARQRDQSPSRGEQFMKQFGKPERALSCDCERSDDPTLGQAFQLLSGRMINEMLSEPDNRLGRLIAAQKTNRDIVEELYLAALCRVPRESEMHSALAFIEKSPDRRPALEDFAWGLLNAKEFLLRH